MSSLTIKFKPIRNPIVLFIPLLMISCNNINNGQNVEASTKNKVDTIPMKVDLKYNYGLDIIMGRFDPAKHPDFKRVSNELADRPGMYLQKDALHAYLEMQKAAAADNIKLVIRSATRNFDYQKGIWERKWTGKTKLTGNIDAQKDIPDPKQRALEILKYSSMPGTSRHHWGTEVDLNSFNNAYFEKGEGLKIFNWLEKNAPQYGFERPYTTKNENRPNGYEEEKWHWSYLPVADELTYTAQQQLTNEMISGFKGADVAQEIDVKNNYVLGIAKSCLP